jgi:hypothetical protein
MKVGHGLRAAVQAPPSDTQNTVGSNSMPMTAFEDWSFLIDQARRILPADE